MSPRTTIRAASWLAVVALLTGCLTQNPPAGPSATDPATAAASSTSSAGSATDAPSPTPTAPATFPLAVVTGLTNLKPSITLAELRQLAERGELVMPCGVQVERPALGPAGSCRPADAIAPFLESRQQRVALLPPGLVEPATKVLRIAGSGPFGLFGPDLFGDPRARARPYPVIGSPTPDAQLDPAWTAYDPSQIWTLTNLGSLCSDRWAAYEAVTNGKGWDWVFNGGTARYAGPAVVDPPDPPPFGAQVPVNPIDAGNGGATPAIVRRSDVAIADHECPVVPSATWQPRGISDPANVFSVPSDVLTHWRDTLGLDVIYLAANHMSDQGAGGIRSTLELLDQFGFPRTGLGMNLRQALEPAYVEVAGLRIAFVAFNDVPGVAPAGRSTPGVAWLTRPNVQRGVRQARAGGADLVICNPQWWGGAEYHDDIWPVQVEQLGWFDEAGCDHVIGSGTHVAGPLLIRQRGDGPSVVLVSPGNYVFGQGWWQETQEGVILDLAFRGTSLVNVRLHPTVQILQARPALLDPEGDGRYVLQRIWKYAQIDSTR
ncbi:MAG TPA: CapA family protein [Candidatus Limnocylindria bacterium]|nr:CapA family protein [Candidatus Limnocylindria bacterium]